MTYLATITGKRQITIPIEVFNKLGLKNGEKVIVSTKDGKMELESAVAQVNRLAGSLKVPKRLADVDIDEAIKIAKERYFKKKYSRKSER